jgi:hypothetical protein
MQTSAIAEPALSKTIGCDDPNVLAFCAATEAAVRDGNIDAISNDALRRAFTAVIRLYAAKAEMNEASEELVPFDTDAVNATETVVAACAMIRAADLNLLDLAMWFGRRPA